LTALHRSSVLDAGAADAPGRRGTTDGLFSATGALPLPGPETPEEVVASLSRGCQHCSHRHKSGKGQCRPSSSRLRSPSFFTADMRVSFLGVEWPVAEIRELLNLRNKVAIAEFAVEAEGHKIGLRIERC
jgi:hypothetical protein